MKIKVRPEDFAVCEVLTLALCREGRYRIYLLHKRRWNTVDAVGAIARASGVPVSCIRYAGLKDRHAVTTQFISVPREYVLSDTVPGVSPGDLWLEEAGFCDDFVSTRNLVGNHFDVVLRSLGGDEAGSICGRVAKVRSGGFANYYDDQRFGSVPVSREFLAEKVLKGHLKGAIRLYLTAEYEDSSAAERERRRALSDAWGDWPGVRGLCKSAAEERVVEALLRGGNRRNLLLALNAIPRQEMTMYFAAFQAAVWNEVLRFLLGQLPGTAFSVPGKVGTYVFPAMSGSAVLPARPVPLTSPTSFGPTSLRAMEKVDIPTIARRTLPCPPDVEAAISEVVEGHGLTRSQFNLRGIHNAYFKSFYRSAVVVPQGLEAGEILPDDLYRGRSKMSLGFALPRGSYATMLLKALCGRGTTGGQGEGREDQEQGSERARPDCPAGV